MRAVFAMRRGYCTSARPLSLKNAKKEPDLPQMNQALLKHLHPEHVEVEICRVEELAQRRGLTSELDEMWSYMGKKAEPRWLWHAIDHHSTPCWCMSLDGERMRFFSNSRVYWSHLVSCGFTQMGGTHTSVILTQNSTLLANSTRRQLKANTSIYRLESNRIICFSKTTTMHDLVVDRFINRYEFGRCI